MKRAILTRFRTDDEGTFGEIVTDSGFKCFTGELPWRGNRKGQSCIAAGLYLAKWEHSPKHGMCYELQDVPGRTDIQLHSANFVGDNSKGKKSQLLGCISPGRQIGLLEGQRAVLSSKDALKSLEDALGRETFSLTIKWADGLRPEVPNADERKSAD